MHVHRRVCLRKAGAVSRLVEFPKCDAKHCTRRATKRLIGQFQESLGAFCDLHANTARERRDEIERLSRANNHAYTSLAGQVLSESELMEP